MGDGRGRQEAVWLTLGLAAFMWFIMFYLRAFNFWVSMAIAAPLLAVLGWLAQGPAFKWEEFNLRNLFLGLAAAAVLYTVFWAGSHFSRTFFSFAGDNIAAIYENRAQAPLWFIGLVLLFLVGPGEELYWRGFVQRQFSLRYGSSPGWLLATAAYAAVHLWSGNFILVMAALVSGLAWGWIYQVTKSVVPGIISHAIWDLVIFVLVPVA